MNATKLINQKASYASKIIDPVIIGLSNHVGRSHLYICDHWVVTSGIRGLCLTVFMLTV